MSKLQGWFLIIALWVIILAVLFFFYWFQVRPAKIRQQCTKEANQACAEIKSSLSNMLEVNQAVYAHCLKRNGVEK
jgi:Na+/melibiose symporter-like transporter